MTLEQYAAAKGLPEEFLRELRVTNLTIDGQPALRIPYLDENGNEQAVQFRLRLDKEQEGDLRFKWRKGSTLCSYGLWRLEEARKAGYIVIVEGPSDAQTLWHHKIPALGLPNATGRFDEYEELLAGIDRIYVVVEPDRGGQTVLAGVGRASLRSRVWVVSLGEAKDPSGLYLSDHAGFGQNWQSAIEAAPKWSDVDADERRDQAAAHFRFAQPLLDDPELMVHICNTIRDRGYAGDVRPAQLGYMAITSRLLDRPMNLAFVALSASGKNAAVDAATALMPPEAIHVIQAPSALSLIHDDDVTVGHKVVIFSEADSIPEDGPAAAPFVV